MPTEAIGLPNEQSCSFLHWAFSTGCSFKHQEHQEVYTSPKAWFWFKYQGGRNQVSGGIAAFWSLDHSTPCHCLTMLLPIPVAIRQTAYCLTFLAGWSENQNIHKQIFLGPIEQTQLLFVPSPSSGTSHDLSHHRYCRGIAVIRMPALKELAVLAAASTHTPITTVFVFNRWQMSAEGSWLAIGIYLPFFKENDLVPNCSGAPAAGQQASLCLLVFLVSCPLNQMENQIWAKGTAS